MLLYHDPGSTILYNSIQLDSYVFDQIYHALFMSSSSNAIPNATSYATTNAALCDVEPVAAHTTAVFRDEVLACSLRIFGVGKEHAFIARELLILAYAAGL